MKAMTAEDFSPLVRQKFKVTVAEGEDGAPAVETELELVEVHETGNDTCEGFSLMFQGSADTLLPQRTYSMENDALGTMPIFIVPVAGNAEGEAPQGQAYQAVFNRLKPTGETAERG